MNAELRAPDPTLAAAEDHVVIAWSETPPVAHLWGCPGSSPALQSIPTEAAQWFAVPCRECFPEHVETGGRTLLTDRQHLERVLVEVERLQDGIRQVADDMDRDTPNRTLPWEDRLRDLLEDHDDR